ncbi:MAG TPA: MazG family protein [Marmoricola sp.]|nr:MazG family protein [Marmoricola sp.]
MAEPALTGRPSGDQPPLLELAEVMRRLRAECPWKSAQTHASLTRYLLEETYEVVEAIETGDAAHLREELGDLLLQVYFHAAIAAEDGEYDVQDVAAGLVEKLVRRNPHVFGPPAAAGGSSLSADQVGEAWEAIKAEEKQRTTLVEGIPEELPALLRAVKVLERLDRAGRPAPAPDGDDLGDRLLALVMEARTAGIDPEQALRAAVRRLT